MSRMTEQEVQFATIKPKVTKKTTKTLAMVCNAFSRHPHSLTLTGELPVDTPVFVASFKTNRGLNSPDPHFYRRARLYKCMPSSVKGKKDFFSHFNFMIEQTKKKQ